jgi:tetratricopeptide (TPR) repeat protein
VKSVPAGFFRKFTPGRSAFASIAAIIIIYLGMFAASAVFTPDYKKFAISTEERDFYNTRGRTSELFQRGLNAVDKKDYGNAVRFFEEDIRNNENEASIFYSHFILGMTYIQSSEFSLLGTFKFFDEEKVEEGVKNLQKAINLNHSGRYENLNLDAHYFIGKAYMLIDKNDLAVDHLKTVVNNKGSYYKKAEKLLEEVSKR